MNFHISIFIMFSIFSFLGCSNNKSNTNNKDALFPKDSFSVLQAKLHGKPVVGSINQAYANYKRKSEYPWCLIITIGLNLDSLNVNGLPLAEESQIAYKEEDELLDSIKKITTAHYIGHIFNNTFLDIYIYLDDPKAVNTFLQREKDKPELKRGIGFKIERDANWQTIKPFMHSSY